MCRASRRPPTYSSQHEAGVLPLGPVHLRLLQVEIGRGRGVPRYPHDATTSATQNDGSKIIQITSPNMSDGKTTLATNLAVSIAQSGKRILLIDADFRRPRLHRMFGVQATVGLASVIQERAELLDAIQPTAVENLSLLPCGPRPPNPAELLTSPRFKEVLETLRDRYDIILVDTPPLLAVSDPSVVALAGRWRPPDDRVSKNGRPAAERARDILATLEANIVGVVVNGIGAQGQEGYGATNYGYQYQYQYAYEPTDNKSYYQDSDPESQILNGVSKNGAGPHLRTDPDELLDPDAVDLGAMPVRPEPRPRERVAHSRRKKSEKGGVVDDLKNWLRSTLWH